MKHTEVMQRITEGKELYVRCSRHERIALITELESRGYVCGTEECAQSPFPLAIDVNRRTIGHMGNAAVSAAAASSGVLISVREFMEAVEELQGIGIQ